jgi:hypothetical protein
MPRTARATPFLGQPAGLDPIQASSEFLIAREAELQAQLAAVDAELAHLENTAGDLESLEQHAAESLRALLDLVEPPDRPPLPVLRSEPAPPAMLPAAQPRRRARTILYLALAAVFLAASALLGAGLAAAHLSQPAAATKAPATATATPLAGQAPAASPVPPLPTTTPPPAAPASPPPTAVPLALDRRQAAQASSVRILDAAGAVRLDLSLATMAETIQIVDGQPILKALPPDRGGGLHRSSAAFGEEGLTAILVPAAGAPAGLWQTQPGDLLAGCNSDETCYDYRVAAAEVWSPDHLHQFLQEWPAQTLVLIYSIHETDHGTEAWTLQALPAGEAK